MTAPKHPTSDGPTGEDREVCSEPVPGEDHDVVICQQNVGPGNMVGGGEFKEHPARGKSAEAAEAEQDALDQRGQDERSSPAPGG